MGRLSRTWLKWLSVWGATVLIILALAGVAFPRSISTQDYRWVKTSPWVGYSFSESLVQDKKLEIVGRRGFDKNKQNQTKALFHEPDYRNS